MHTDETQSRRESCIFSFNHLILIIIIIVIIIIIIIIVIIIIIIMLKLMLILMIMLYIISYGGSKANIIKIFKIVLHNIG